MKEVECMFPKKRKEFGFFDFDEEFERINEMMERMMEDAMKGMEHGGPVKKGGPRVYGFSMRIGQDGKPVIEEFGNVKKEGTALEDEREPLVDVIERKDDVTVIAEVPGVEKKDIKLKVKEGGLHIHVESRERKYDKFVKLPAKVKSRGTETHYKNGVLEVKLKKEEPGMKGEGQDIKVE